MPGPDDVLVRSHAAGVCRTDIEMVIGQLTDPRWVRFPLVPGHEWSGTIAAVGERVADLAPGDRVVCEGMIPCNRCRRCKAGDTQLCENYDQLGFTRGGGYGEYVLVPRHVVHGLPDDVSFDAGVLVEPASVVLRGLDRAAPQPGETVGVIGIGTLGSLAVTLARLRAPGALVAYGIRPEELAFAERLGARRRRARRRDRRRRGDAPPARAAGSTSWSRLPAPSRRSSSRPGSSGPAGASCCSASPARGRCSSCPPTGSCSATCR